jgi:hypothetical protein
LDYKREVPRSERGENTHTATTLKLKTYNLISFVQCHKNTPSTRHRVFKDLGGLNLDKSLVMFLV